MICFSSFLYLWFTLGKWCYCYSVGRIEQFYVEVEMESSHFQLRGYKALSQFHFAPTIYSLTARLQEVAADWGTIVLKTIEKNASI